MAFELFVIKRLSREHRLSQLRTHPDNLDHSRPFIISPKRREIQDVIKGLPRRFSVRSPRPCGLPALRAAHSDRRAWRANTAAHSDRPPHRAVSPPVRSPRPCGLPARAVSSPVRSPRPRSPRPILTGGPTPMAAHSDRRAAAPWSPRPCGLLARAVSPTVRSPPTVRCPARPRALLVPCGLFILRVSSLLCPRSVPAVSSSPVPLVVAVRILSGWGVTVAVASTPALGYPIGHHKHRASLWPAITAGHIGLKTTT